MAKAWDFKPSDFMKTVDEDVGKKLRILSLALLTEIVQRSPVDSGRFRANNVVSIGNPNNTFTDDKDKTGVPTMQAGNAVIAQGKPYSVIYIQNNLPYAEKIEHGHSEQAAAGVYAVAFHSVTAAYE